MSDTAPQSRVPQRRGHHRPNPGPDIQRAAFPGAGRGCGLGPVQVAALLPLRPVGVPARGSGGGSCPQAPVLCPAGVVGVLAWGCLGDPAAPCALVASAWQITCPSPQRSLNCNNTYGEEPDMFRTALGESTASLDSTLRSGQVAGMGRGGPALRARAAFVPSVPAVCPALQVHVCLLMCFGSLVAKNLPEPGVAALHTQKVLGGCAMLPPAPSSGAEPTVCPPGTPGARSSACPLGRCGAAMGSQPRPLSPGVPRSPTVRVPWRVVSFLGAGGGGHGPGPPAGSCLSCGPPATGERTPWSGGHVTLGGSTGAQVAPPSPWREAPPRA